MSVEVSPKIQSEEEYQAVRSTLNEKNKPSSLMTRLMNGMESYRQSKKYGWSRPWNKSDLVNFKSFKLQWPADGTLMKQFMDVLTNQFSEMPLDSLNFCKDLIGNEDALMGYIFTHDFLDNGVKYEGVTISLGRVNNKRYRDRVDLILESRVIDGKSLGLERVRLYVDPYQEKVKEPTFKQTTYDLDEHCNQLFSTLVNLSWSWHSDPNRVWNHWIMDYMDYFGARTWKMRSSFFQSDDQSITRLLPN